MRPLYYHALLLTMLCSQMSVFPHSCLEGAMMSGVQAQRSAEASLTVLGGCGLDLIVLPGACQCCLI